ncbi:MAG: cytochrome P450, partial [Hymenobacter sp.]
MWLLTLLSYNKIRMNAMVPQFDKNAFGDDAHEFQPTRWLESEKRYWAMDKAILVFGAGTRTCIGKHVSRKSFRCMFISTDMKQSS